MTDERANSPRNLFGYLLVFLWGLARSPVVGVRLAREIVGGWRAER